MPLPEDDTGYEDSYEYEVDLNDGRHWTERYIEDSCNRCPECCVELTENGIIDEYGVERPLSWLPDDEPQENSAVEAAVDLGDD